MNEQPKPTIAAVLNAQRALTLLGMDVAGEPILDIINVFGETEDHRRQVENARKSLARFASVYC